MNNIESTKTMSVDEMVKDEALDPTTLSHANIDRNDVASLSNGLAMLHSITSNDKNNQVFACSIKDDGSRAAKVKIYNAINNKGISLSDHIGEVFEVQNMAAHCVTLPDEQTGEMVDCLRVVFVSQEGETYEAISMGVLSSLQKMIPIVGPAPWEPALKIRPVQIKTRKGFKTLTLELAE